IATLPRGSQTLTYRGTDDAGTTRSGSIQVVLNDAPSVNMVAPVNAYDYFGGQSLNFSANGTDSGGTAIPAANFKWFRDGTLFKTGFDSFSATVADLPTGTRQIAVQVRDGFNEYNGATVTIDVGFAIPTVTAPASGTRFALGTNLNLTGSPDLTGEFNTEWYWVEGAAVFGAGPNASIATLTRGLQTLTYRGTDDGGTTRSGSIQVIFNDAPSVSLVFPVDTDSYFGGQTLNFSANGTDSGGTAIPAANFKWYRDGTLFKTGFSAFTATIAELPTGTRDISVQVRDGFNEYNGATATVDLGETLPTVSSPASGTKYALGANVVLTGSPDYTGKFASDWYWTQGAAVFGDGPNASIATLTRGLHTLSYRGTDDNGTVRSGSIQIVLNNAPAAAIALPVNNGRYFGYQTLSFSGTGTDSGGGAIAAANFKWFRDTTNFKSGVDAFTATVAEMPTGTRDIGLQVKDEFNAYGGATYTIEVGVSHPTISSPASGTRFAIGANVNFTGSPDSGGPLTMDWYLDNVTLMGSGANISYAFPTRGLKTITYIGTDSAGLSKSKTIQIVINDPPTFTISDPDNNGKYFGGQNINFSGSGTDSGGFAIPVASLRWYKNSALYKSGTNSFAGTVAELPTGTINISLGGFDDLGTFNSATYTIQVGIGLPSITAPASGTRFDTGATVSFTGTPDLTALIATDWWWPEGTTSFGGGPTINTAALTRGVQTITYIGTDTQNTARSSTIQVLIDKLPTFISKPFISSPAKFADGPEYPLPSNYIPIHLASPGMQVTFSVTAQEEDTDIIAPAKINWYDGAVLLGNVATLTRNFETPGSYTYTVQVQDEYNQISTASFTFWIWDSEGYNTFTPVGGAPFGPGTLSGPTAISAFGNNAAFVIDPGNSRIVKLNRLTAGLTTIGDFPSIATETAVASQTHPYLDISYSGTTLYSLGNLFGGTYRIQSWDTANLHSSTRNYYIPDGNLSTQFKNPFGFCVDANAIYVADTDNNRIKKLDI
ncbi:MAG: PKD domain-containing protein, partial [Candidatus Riflebacteria bacterium]